MTEFLHRSVHRAAATLCLASALVLAGCGSTPDDPSGPPASGAPSIASFTATPSTLTAGESAVLSWSVQGADTLSISPGVGTVEGEMVTVAPTETTTYTLTAQNTTGASDAQMTIIVTPESDPLLADVTLDDERAARGYLPAGGGALSATGADGTVYTLAVPPGALLQPTRLRLTPLASVSGLPISGGIVAGVALEPAGLAFGAPVVLKIEPAVATPVEEQIGFAFPGDGGETHLYPLAGPADAIELRLARTGGYLVGRGTDAERNEALAHAPSDARARLEQALAPLFHNARAGGMKETELRDAVEAALREGYRQYVLPALGAAEGTLRIGGAGFADPGVLPASGGTPSVEALQTFNQVFAHWEQQLVLHGFGGDFMRAERDDLNARLFEVVSVAAEALMGRCVEEHDLTVIGYLLELQRMLERAGLTDEGFSLESCLSFRLEFDSTVTLDHSTEIGPTAFTAHVSASVPLTFDLTGSTTSVYGSFSKRGAFTTDGVTCSHRDHGTPEGDVLTVVGGSVDFLEGSGSTMGEGMYLTVDVGMPTEHTLVTCTNGDTWTFDGHEWLAYFQLSHRDDMIDDQWIPHPVVITGWEVVQPTDGSDVIARKTYTGSWAGAATDTTTLVLRHVPVGTSAP